MSTFQSIHHKIQAAAYCNNCRWVGLVSDLGTVCYQCGQCPECGQLAYQASYPEKRFIQLCFDAMPAYVPNYDTESNDPLLIYACFISTDRATLDADIADNFAEYQRQVKSGERDADDVPATEWVEECTIHADGSIVIGDRTITKQQIFKHFGIEAYLK